MGKQSAENVGSSLNPLKIIMRASKYFARNRSLYQILRKDYKSPSYEH